MVVGGFSESQTQIAIVSCDDGQLWVCVSPMYTHRLQDAACQGGCGQDCRAGRNTEQGELQRGWRSPKMREEGQCVESMGLKTGSEGSYMYEAKEMERIILD